MKIFWEAPVWAGATIEPTITSLAWMPSASKEGRGLLAVGSESGVVGITFTDITADEQCNRRYNFNLRGHHSAIAHVSWNRSQSKLVSCDSSGFIYVWVPNDERWTVELVNDRGVKVRDFCWSPNGNATLICYDDNFVLIGTAGGQRVWSNSYDMMVPCGAWSPNSDEVVLGFTSGFIQVLNELGNVVHERELFSASVAKVAFSSVRESDGKWTLAACSASNEIVFTNTYYEVEPFSYQSPDDVHRIEWSNDGTMLAVICASNRIVFLSHTGKVLHNFTVPLSKTPLSAFTWAHDDTTVIIAAGGSLAVGRIVRGVPLLSQLVSYRLWDCIHRDVSNVDELPLPNREREALKQFDHHVIRCRVPKAVDIPRAICEPTDWRWYCTIVPVPRKSYHYMLCMEHMGGLVPILLGRQINRIIPQFLISLPPQLLRRDGTPRYDNNASSAQVEDIGNFRRESNQRNSLWRQSKRHIRRFMNKRVTNRGSRNPPTLVSVTSNVWCTKFKITAPGIDHLPHYLANVVYKTSVLHLQPRQMTIHLSDLRDIPTEPLTTHSLTASPAAEASLISSAAQSAPASSRQTPATLRVPAFDAISATSSASGSTPTVNNASNNAGVFNGSNFNEADVEELQRLLDDAGDAPMEFDDDHATELLTDEKIFYRTVMTEFDGLRQALNSHIDRMKQFATEIELASVQLAVQPPQQSLLSRSLQVLTRSQPTSRESSETPSRPSAPVNSPVLEHAPEASTSTVPVWDKLDNIDFIDDDEALLVANSSSTAPLIADDEVTDTPTIKATPRSTLASMSPSFSAETSSKKRQKQLNDIRNVVEKLSMMSNELSVRVPPSTGRNPSTNLRVGNNAVGSKAAPTLKQELPSEMTVAQLRAEVRNIAQQVSQIEEKITIDMLNDIRGDLQQRVQHIKAVLGEPLLAETGRKRGGKSKAAQRMLTMTNKTPFWNEQTQVYQLDFGGRVTQESAKNFQIEYNSEQVMQFGRIENGAYTLDFRAPFSAVQAFAIALASITQRLK
uniref:Tub domain-containing protein n=1 Tax=Panagrellus redivivus TaxID=6233 RepID=A0A7E4V4L2_PANRE